MSKRGEYGKWSNIELQMAITAYKSGEYGLNETARLFSIPKATLKRHCEGKSNGRSFGRKPVFTKEMEYELTDLILASQKDVSNLKIDFVQKLAYKVAEKYGLIHPFNKEDKKAGKKWYYSFMRRHGHLFPSKVAPRIRTRTETKNSGKTKNNHFFDLWGDFAEKRSTNSKRDSLRSKEGLVVGSRLRPRTQTASESSRKAKIKPQKKKM